MRVIEGLWSRRAVDDLYAAWRGTERDGLQMLRPLSGTPLMITVCTRI